MRINFLSIIVFGTLAGQMALPAAQAQNYPNRPSRLIVPYQPGTPADTLARGVSQFLPAVLGQPMVVENRPGANGAVGMEVCARSAPDGYTLCFPSNSAISLNPFIYAKLAYDPPRDLAPIINMGFTNSVILVHPSLPVNSLRELIDLSKSKPGAIAWSSFGYGSISHLYLEWLNKAEGASFHHVPYKGGPEALMSAVAGEVQATLNSVGSARQLVLAGRLKALGTTGDKRSGSLPAVPTIRELGFDIQYRAWYGVFTPAGSPKDIVQRLNGELNRLLIEPRFRDQFLLAQTIDSVGGSVEDMVAFLKTDREATERLVKVTGVKAE